MNISYTPALVGPRVKHARETKGLTQDQLKAALGFNDRQTVSDIENGKRAVKADELFRLSELLDQDIEYFVDPFSVAGEAQYSWRASKELPLAELNRFEGAASGWVGMLRWLRDQDASSASPLKYALKLGRNSTFELVQQRAEQLVAELNLGVVPAEKLVDCIEKQFDIPVLFVDTGDLRPEGAISGAVCHMDAFGVILVNRHEPAGRQNFNLAHELFHLLTWELMRPIHRESNSLGRRNGSRRDEQLADNFAAALLMPRSSLDLLIGDERGADIAHLADVASKLQVTPTALGWRLFNLRRIDIDTQEKLAQVRLIDREDDVPRPFSASFVSQLHVALDRGRISARKAAKTLGLPLSGLAELFVAYGLSAPFEL